MVKFNRLAIFDQDSPDSARLVCFNLVHHFHGLDDADEPVLMIYEVNNTFGQSQTYVLPVEADHGNGLIVQGCDKQLYVSPFNEVEGRYLFHVTPADENVTVGVALKTGDGPLLRAHFTGRRHPVTDRELARALAGFGWMTINVVVAIHWQALKLWFKGLRLRPNPHSGRGPIRPKSISTPIRE